MDPHGTEFVYSPVSDPQVDKTKANRKCLKPSIIQSQADEAEEARWLGREATEQSHV